MKRKLTMLITLAIILIVLWYVGLLTAYTMGGAIHVLLLFAIILIFIKQFNKRRAL